MIDAFAIASLALGTLLYVLVGYPLLLNWWSRRFARPVKREPIQPTLSIIIPAYNGGRFLSRINSIPFSTWSIRPERRRRVTVVSDGSTDRTDSIAEAYASRGVRLLRVPRGGKPAALNAAIPLARGEILVLTLTDVRQVLAPESVRLLVESFADPSVGTVSGELIIRKGDTREASDIGLYWRLETMMRDNLSKIDSMFGATGPFYAIRRELAVPIPEDSLLDDMYLPLAAFFRGYRLIMDARARAFDYPTSLEVEFNRKVRTLAGNYQILRAYPALLGPGNRMWLHFMSYKFGRLLLPWCLIALAVASLHWLTRSLAMWLLLALDPGDHLCAGRLRPRSSWRIAQARLVSRAHLRHDDDRRTASAVRVRNSSPIAMESHVRQSPIVGLGRDLSREAANRRGKLCDCAEPAGNPFPSPPGIREYSAKDFPSKSNAISHLHLPDCPIPPPSQPCSKDRAPKPKSWKPQPRSCRAAADSGP